jgi:hypothetical protein
MRELGSRLPKIDTSLNKLNCECLYKLLIVTTQIITLLSAGNVSTERIEENLEFRFLQNVVYFCTKKRIRHCKILI